MTKRDFFRIIIKLFGLYSLILVLFNYLPTTLSYINLDPNFGIVLLMSAVLIIGTIIFYMFIIKKADIIIDFLKLDNGFDNDIVEFGKFNHQDIVKLGVIIIGGLLMVDYLPEFLTHCYSNLRNEFGGKLLIENSNKRQEYFNWSFSFINTIIGYLLLTNVQKATNWIIKKNEQNVG